MERIGHHKGLVAALAVLLSACGGGEAGQTVAWLEYEAVVPPGFSPRPSTSSMRLAEYEVPSPDGPSAEVIVYYFGPGQGGSADANIARWSSQFTGPDGGSVTPRVTMAAGAAFPTTIAEFEGAYARGVGVGDVVAEAGQGLVAAVVETPMGNLFLQLFGDRAAVASAREDFLSLVTSIRGAGGMQT